MTQTPLSRAIDNYWGDGKDPAKMPYLVGLMEAALSRSMADPSTLQHNVLALIQILEKES